MQRMKPEDKRGNGLDDRWQTSGMKRDHVCSLVHRDSPTLMTSTIVVQLSDTDHIAVSTCSITYEYVVAGVDLKKLEEAFGRVASRWRLLAGRVEWNAKLRRYHIRVPLGEQLQSNHPVVSFTSSEHLDLSLGVRAMHLDASSACILTSPPGKYFRTPSTPNSLHTLASQNLPIVSIHVSTLQDCVCIGLTLPHGVFDGVGMGMVIQALDAELNGKDWEVPAIQEANLLVSAQKGLEEGPSLVDDRPDWTERLSEDFTSMGILGLGRFVLSLAYETYWHKAKRRGVFLGENVIRKIVDEVKQQVSSKGTDWVSTGDILVAWLFKVHLASVRPLIIYLLTIPTGGLSRRIGQQ